MKMNRLRYFAGLGIIFGLAGITDIKFINAQPMDMGPELQRKKIAEAKKIAEDAAATF